MTERFFIDHGVIHDNKTGKHVRTCDCLAPMEGGIREACDLLNELSKSTSPQPDRESEKCRHPNRGLARCTLKRIGDTEHFICQTIGCASMPSTSSNRPQATEGE